MKPTDIHETATELHALCAKVIGYYDLIDRADELSVPIVDRIVNQAQFTANAMRMAELGQHLLDLLTDLEVEDDDE